MLDAIVNWTWARLQHWPLSYCNPIVSPYLWEIIALTPNRTVSSHSPDLLPSLRSKKEEDMRCSKDQFVSITSVWDTRQVAGTNIKKLTCTLTQPLQNLRLPIPNPLTTLHLITTKPELQNRTQTKRKSSNLKTRCAVANVLPFCITASERWTRLFENRCAGTVIEAEKHTCSTPTKLSVSQF